MECDGYICNHGPYVTRGLEQFFQHLSNLYLHTTLLVGVIE